MASIAALLLAAGESTRMGELKALLQWQGNTLIEHQIAALASAGVSKTVVVLGHQSEKVESLIKDVARVQCVYNPDYRQGKTTSIKAGLRALRQVWESDPGTPREEAVLVLNADQPRSADTIRRLVELHLRPQAGLPEQPSLITIPTYQGKGGHPIILSTSLMPELMGISEDSLGLRDVVRRHSSKAQRVEIDAPEVLLDLNTPEDYHKAQEILGPG